MAITYTKLPNNFDLDVVPVYKELMEASVGQGSIYLKAKETIVEYVNSGNLTEREKAEFVSKHIADIASSITAQALQAAMTVVRENRDAPYALTKMVEDTKLVSAQVAKIEKDIDKADEDTALITMAVKKAQAELYRDYGVSAVNLSRLVTDLDDNTDFTNYGTKVETIKMSQANVYNGYSTAYRQNGLVLPIIDGTTGWLTTGTTGDASGLSYWQTRVAERQHQGFDDNTRQHVANSSATMVSMLLSSEEAALVDDASAALAKWTTAVDYLNNA